MSYRDNAKPPSLERGPMPWYIRLAIGNLLATTLTILARSAWMWAHGWSDWSQAIAILVWILGIGVSAFGALYWLLEVRMRGAP